MRNKETRITTIIGLEAECNGDFSAQGSARIDGCINGNVTVTGTLIVGAAGIVNGDIYAKDVIIGGEIIGNINVSDRTELISTARVFGDITTTLIIIDEKAIFQGSCNMNQETPEKRQKSSPRAMKAGKKSAKAAIEEALKEVEETSRSEGKSMSDAGPLEF